MLSRRRLLALAGAAATAASPGCLDGVAGDGAEGPAGSPTTPATNGTPATLGVTSASLSDVAAPEPVAVLSEPLRELLGAAAASDGPATVVASLVEWESRPPALAAPEAANLRFEDGRASDGTYSLSLRWGPVYDDAFAVDAVEAGEVPADETPVDVAEQPPRVREPLVEAVRSGSVSLSPRSEAYFVLVAADEEAAGGTTPVAYLRYEGRYYAVVRLASTPVPTDEVYLRLRASRRGPVDDRNVTLSVAAVSDAVRSAFEGALGAWSAGEGGYVVEGSRDAVAEFDARYDYVTTAADVFRFELRSGPER